DGYDILRQEIQQAAAEMTLEKAIFFDPAEIDRQQLGPAVRRQYLRNRVLISEKQAQRHTRRLRKMHKKYPRTLRSPENTIAHMTMHSRLTLRFQQLNCSFMAFACRRGHAAGQAGRPYILLRRRMPH